MEEQKKSNPSQNDLYYEEINLFDLLQKIWKWKFLTLAIVIIFLISTYFYISLKPVTYTSETVVKIGKIANTIIEQIPDIQAYLQSEASQDNDCSALIKSSEIDKNTIKISITSASPEISYSCLENISKSLLNRHDLIYKKALAKINDNIASTKTKMVLDPVYILETYTFPSSVTVKPVTPAYPDSKKMNIKLAVAFFASLFIGIFISFFIEYILAHRKIT